jgi:hypothetical protein
MLLAVLLFVESVEQHFMLCDPGHLPLFNTPSPSSHVSCRASTHTPPLSLPLIPSPEHFNGFSGASHRFHFFKI